MKRTSYLINLPSILRLIFFRNQIKLYVFFFFLEQETNLNSGSPPENSCENWRMLAILTNCKWWIQWEKPFSATFNRISGYVHVSYCCTVMKRINRMKGCFSFLSPSIYSNNKPLDHTDNLKYFQRNVLWISLQINKIFYSHVYSYNIKFLSFKFQ